MQRKILGTAQKNYARFTRAELDYKPRAYQAKTCVLFGFTLLQYRAFVRRRNELRVAREVARRHFGGKRLPCGAAFCKLAVAHFQRNLIIIDVERDVVAFLHERDWTANGGFWRAVTERRAARRA